MSDSTSPPVVLAPAPAPVLAPAPAPAIAYAPQAAPMPASSILQPQAAPQLPAHVPQMQAAPQPQQPQMAPAPQVYAAPQVRPAGALVTYGQGAARPQPAPVNPVEKLGSFVQKNQREIVAAGLGALALSLLRGGSLPGSGGSGG